MKLILLVIGKTDESWLREGMEEYAGRLSRYLPFEMEVIPDLRNRKRLSEAEQKQAEGELILARLKPGDRLYLLDERGKQPRSTELAEWLQRNMNAGYKRLILTVGGPYGFSDAVYDRADGKLSLSKLTFSHQMVRLFALEQLYRAMTILRNEPYHHE